MARLSARDIVVGIDPTSRGFAFAVLEAPSFLVDWGERIVSSKRGALLRKVDELLTYHEPAVLAIEDVAAKGCRRRKRGREEIRRIERLAKARGVRVARVSRLAVRDTLARGKGKYEVALQLAQVFPVLADRIPRRRKPYMSEDQRMNVLDALGFAAVLVARGSRSPPRRSGRRSWGLWGPSSPSGRPTDARILAREFEPELGASDLTSLPNHEIYVRLMVEGIWRSPPSVSKKSSSVSKLRAQRLVKH